MAGQDELVLLERVFLRIGSADTDEQLQNVLSKFLLPVLLKLESPQEGVRKKVMELLVHVNKRLKSRSNILLPIDALFLQYKDPNATSFLMNFTIIYIKMGYPRLPVDRQLELIPSLLNCLENKPQQHQDSLLCMLMPILHHLKISVDHEKCKYMFGLSEKPQVSRLLCDFIFDFLLLPYGFTMPITTVKTGSQGCENQAHLTPPPGLSEQACKRVIGEQQLPSDQLEQAKLGAVKFLSCGVYNVIDVVPHLIVASSDTRHSVASAADLELKRAAGSVDWNNRLLISKLFSLFLGTVVTKEQKHPVKPEQKRVAANTRIRLKLFPYLLKSREASLMFPSSIQVVFEALYGQNTNSKLKTMAVQFVHHICSNCSEARLAPIGTVLMSGMLKVISDTSEDVNIRCLAYVAVGKLGLKLPQLITKDVAMIQSFFDALVKEEQDIKIAIQESLSLLAKAFNQADAVTQQLMEALLMSNIEHPETQVRQMALHYAITIFPFDHIPSRYIILLATGDIKEEIKREAIKALHDYLQNEDSNKRVTYKSFPPFPEIVVYMSEKVEDRLQTRARYVSGNVILPFNVAVYIEMMHYMRFCLANSAGVPSNLLKSNDIYLHSPIISAYIKKLLMNGSMRNSVHQYIAFYDQLLPIFSGPSIIRNLLEVIAAAPDVLATNILKHLQLAKNLISTSNEEVREYAAQLVAIILAYGVDMPIHNENFDELLCNVNKQHIDLKHGSLLTLGYLIGWKLNIANQNSPIPEWHRQDNRLKEAIQIIVHGLTSEHMLLSSAACMALGEIAKNGALPLPDGNPTEEKEKNIYTKLGVVSALVAVVNSAKTHVKCKERAALASGYLFVGDKEFPFRKILMEGLLQSVFENTDIEINFTIGEALCCAILGESSFNTQSLPLQDKNCLKTPVCEVNSEELEWLLNEILQKYVVHIKPNVRQASSVWVLTLLKHCGQLSSIQIHLKLIQNAVLNLLADNSDFTQSIASKCLSILYELGSEEMKKDLVSLLVETLTAGRRSYVNLTADTKIFEEGTLGTTPTGGGLTTYKELCSFASDLNQPDLIYKFMHLANHNTIWNSKKGAAYGFGSIAEVASEELSQHLPKIVPKLYRYQYDPSSAIRNSFSAIWHAVVPNPQKAVDIYVKDILQDLIQNLTSPQWRIRESSCLALSDLLRGRSTEELIDHLPVLWETCFRVRDDIKVRDHTGTQIKSNLDILDCLNSLYHIAETVRNAAETALKTLSKTCIRLCDINSGKSGENTLSVVLPCLVKSGLSSSVAEVRAISLSTIVQISKNAGAMLKPHLPLLIIALLEALSSLEPQMLSYLSVRLESDETSQEKLDSARISASHSSPMMETINQSVPYIDKMVLQELVPQITDLIRSSVGLSTKTGCSHLMVTLSHQCPNDLQPFAGKLIMAFVSCLKDKNATVRKSYATAIGHLVKVAKDSSVQKLLSKLQDWYMEKNEEVIHSSCAFAVHAIARNSPDVLRNHAAQILPLAFFAMHAKLPKGTNSTIHQLWEEVWQEFTPGTEGGVRLYLIEIVDFGHRGLESQSWPLKEQAADTFSTLAKSIGENLDYPHLNTVLNALLNGISGRTWTGKESLLQAIACICVNCKKTIQQTTEYDEPIIENVVKLLIRECSKEKLSYKEEAIKSLAVILENYELDYFQQVFDIIIPYLTKNPVKKLAFEDGDENSSDIDDILQFKETAFDCLGQSWPTKVVTQDQYSQQFCKVMVSEFSISTWKVQLSILKAGNKFVSRLHLHSPEIPTSEVQSGLISNLFTIIFLSYGMVKYSVVRNEGLLLTECIIKKIKENHAEHLFNKLDMKQVKSALQSLSDREANPQIKDRACQLLKELSTVTE